MRSVFIEGQEVTVRPLATSASASIQPAWQIAASGFPALKMSRVKATILGSMRSLSGE